MSKSLFAAVAAAASLLAAGAAHAGNVYWSVGISAPAVGTVISNAPPVVVAPAPVVYAPPPVVYAPPPVVYEPAPVVVRPVPRVVYGAPVVIGRPVPVGYYGGGWGDRDHDGIPNRYDRYDNRWGHPHHGGWDRDRDGVPDRYDRRDDRKYRH